MPFTLLKPTGIDLSQTFAFTGTVTGDNGGTVVQKVIVQDQAVSNDIVTTSSSFVTTGIEVTITPTSASNMIDVFFVSSMSTSQNNSDEGNAMCYVNDANATWQGGSSPSNHFWQVAYKIDSGNKYAPIVWSGRYDPSNTNALKFTIYHRRESGSGNSGMRTVHSYSSYLFSAMEVTV